MNKAVYVIGSYAPCEGRSESTNVTRAVALGSLALATGHVPIIPHLTIGCSSILLGRFTPNVDADELAREASYGKNGTGGLAAMLRDSMMSMDIVCWVILKDDGTMSSGTQAEYDEFTSDPIGVETRARTWSEWEPWFADAGLGNLYTEISKPITGFQRWPNDEGPFIYLNLPIDLKSVKTLDDLVKAAGPEGPSTCGALDDLVALSEDAGGYPELDVSKIAKGLHADSVTCLRCGVTTRRKVDGDIVRVAEHRDTCTKDH